MRNKFLSIISTILCFFTACTNKQEAVSINHTFKVEDKTIYQFKNIETISGEFFDFSTLRGKKIMIVNTASKCGLTHQYSDLQNLYSKFKDKDFVIIAFPSNNFLSQEPGTHKEIATFCKVNYGVEFPIMAKINVKGDEVHPLYKFLTEKNKNNFSDNSVKWNFQKYLIGEEGKLEKVISPRTNPFDSEIINWIQN